MIPSLIAAIVVVQFFQLGCSQAFYLCHQRSIRWGLWYVGFTIW